MKLLPPVRYRLIGLPGRAETEVKEDKWSRWLKDERWPDRRDPLDREPRLRPDEQLQLSCIAERLTMVGRTPGIREDNNVYGGAVNIASRISGLSAPGEVLVSDVVRTLARTSAGVQFDDRGEQTLRGVGEPVRVWAVRME